MNSETIDQLLITGLQLAEAGAADQAAEMFAALLASSPERADVWFALAEVRRQQQDARAAFAAYLETVRRDPEHAEAHYWLSMLLQNHHPLDALRHVQLTLESVPEHAAGREQLSRVYLQLQARGCGRELTAQLDRRPEDVYELLKALSALPAIPYDEAEMQAAVALLEEAIAVLQARRIAFDPELLLQHDLVLPRMLLHYGLDGMADRRLREAYAGLFRLEPLALTPQAGAPRIGFVVGPGRVNLFLRFQAGLMRELSRLRPGIDWVLVGPTGLDTKVSGQLPGWGYLALPEHLPAAAQLVAAAGFDLLYYWECGPETLSYFLAMLKPARVQCAGTGWPITSGLKTMDYYLSSQRAEPADAQRFYTECLRLQPGWAYPGLAPLLPERPAGREHWGFRAAQRLYVCLQHPFKLHPGLDPLFHRILAADPDGLLVLIGHDPWMGQQLYRRLLRSGPEHAARIHVLPRQSHLDYLSLVLTADVVLDSWPYAGGGTSADLLVCGTPVVTLSGPQQCGRWTRAVLEAAGLPELIAATPEEYVKIALQVAQDKTLRQRLSQTLIASSDALLADPTAVTSFLELLEGML